MNTSGVWAPYLCSQVISLNHLSYGSRFRVCTIGLSWRMGRFSMVSGIHTHLDDMPASQHQSIDWAQHTSCQSSIRIENHSIHHDRPMVHTRDREPVTQVVVWNNLTTEILGSNPTGVHSLMRLPKACWWDLMMIETAVWIWFYDFIRRKRIMGWLIKRGTGFDMQLSSLCWVTTPYAAPIRRPLN